MRAALAALRRRGRAARLRLWALRLDARLRRNGSRLVLERGPGAGFESPPVVELMLEGGAGPGELRLRLGPGASLGRGLILELWVGARGALELGESSWLGAGCRLALHGGSISVGDRAQLRDYVHVKSRGEVRIGDRAIVSRGVIIHADERVTVGEFCAVGERTSLIDSDHTLDGSDTPFFDMPSRTDPVTLGRNVLVGANSVILRGTTLGPNSAVGAGSVVNGGDHPAGWLVAGVPARDMRPLSRAAAEGR